MAGLTAEMTLAQLVSEYPRLAREFETRGLDYCCHGDRTLAVACRDAGLDAGTIAVELADVSGERVAAESTPMDMRELVDHLEATHHRYLHVELPRLTDLLDKVVRAHGANHPELTDVQSCFAALRADLQPHLAKEERVLFPAIRVLHAADRIPQFPFGSIRNPVSMMMREHDTAGELLSALRRATSDFEVPPDGCASYRACFDGLAELTADTHLHIHKENNLLFPAVVAFEGRVAESAL